MLAEVHREPTGAGPLDGVSVAVKELVGIGGHQLSANSEVQLPDRWAHPEQDSAFVAALRAGGAHIVGTTTTHEFAWGITTYDRGRRVVNPVMPGRIAGGSSGGSAEAVSKGEADLGIGTDTAGSVRIPAAWCHLLGWKFTDGLVSMDGILPLSPGLDHPGLLAREADVLLRAADALGATGTGQKPTILMPPEEALSGVDPVAAALATHGAELLAHGEGLPLAAVDHYPSKSELMTCFGLLQGPAVLVAHRDIIGTWPSQRDRYPDYIVERLMISEQRSNTELQLGARLQARIRNELDILLVDSILVLPVTGCAPPLTSTPEFAEIDGERIDLRSVVLPNTVAANVAGLPAVTVPAVAEGNEYGVQLLGPAGSDITLLEMARSLMAERSLNGG
jgi:Asp-tRNA(Asn)/Glu-tRNA(Gln) amidotransferase A subunit family amidase